MIQLPFLFLKNPEKTTYIQIQKVAHESLADTKKHYFQVTICAVHDLTTEVNNVTLQDWNFVRNHTNLKFPNTLPGKNHNPIIVINSEMWFAQLSPII